MRVRIKRIDKSLPMPEYHTSGAAAFDMYARETVTVLPGEIARIPSNLIVATPPGYLWMVTLRSSTPKKKPGLIVPHGVGIIDSDYCGPNDEGLIQVQNVSQEPIVIERGERFAQGTFVHTSQGEFEEVEVLNDENRGGFGSTD